MTAEKLEVSGGVVWGRVDEVFLWCQVPVKLKAGGYVPFVRAKRSMFWCMPECDIDNYDP